MKRTLFEVVCGLAVIVLVVSLHHQIARLKVRTHDVQRLEAMVHDAVAKVGGHEDQSQQSSRALVDLEEKLNSLRVRVTDAATSTVDAKKLRRELADTRRMTSLLRSRLETESRSTKELVDAYHREVRALDRRSRSSVDAARGEFERLASEIAPDPAVMTREMLAPAVQLNGDDTVGSGTLLWSGRNPKTRKIETYVITSHHVVRNIFADTPRARQDGVSVTIYREGGNIEERADMIAHDTKIDAALLKLRSDRLWPQTARILSRQDAKRIRVWDRIHAVGCPLGNDPIPTNGEISSVHNVLNGANYWMINAPTYFGNSGGGVYLAGDRALVGVFSKIYTHGRGNPVVVPHMGLCTPLPLIYDWLDKEKLSFVLDLAKRAKSPGADIGELASPPR